MISGIIYNVKTNYNLAIIIKLSKKNIFYYNAHTTPFLPIIQRECISVHVGQAGCQIGNACWELYCLEHGKSS